MQKKIIYLIVSIAVIIGLFFVVRNLSSKKGKSDTELFSFNIEDTASVDRIVIADAHSRKMELIRGANGWTDVDGNCIIDENIKHVLYIFKNIEFKGYVAEGSRKQHINLLSTSATKVDIYQDGDLTKTWYVGTATPDHYGQVMLLESASEGKSDLPVLMKVRGLNGIIEPSFIADIRSWACTEILAIPIRDIKKVEVNYLDDKGRSFSVEQNNFKFKVKQAGQPIQFADTTAVLRYLSGFKKVNYEKPNYSLNDKEIDSLKNSKPFRTLKISQTSGKSIYLKMYRLKAEENYDTEFGEIINHDANSFWCVLPNGSVVKCQYFVFDPLTRGDIYFPFDKTRFEKQVNGGNE
jgi:hypothetical protein